MGSAVEGGRGSGDDAAVVWLLVHEYCRFAFAPRDSGSMLSFALRFRFLEEAGCDASAPSSLGASELESE